MKKRILIIGGIVVIFIGIVIASILNDKYLVKESQITIDEDITMEINKDTLTNISATIMITDTNKKENTYNDNFLIEKYEEGKWWVIKKSNKNITTTLPAYTVGEDNTLTMDLNWLDEYGTLDSGKYRIAKEISNGKYVTAEFTITAENYFYTQDELLKIIDDTNNLVICNYKENNNTVCEDKINTINVEDTIKYFINIIKKSTIVVDTGVETNEKTEKENNEYTYQFFLLNEDKTLVVIDYNQKYLLLKKGSSKYKLQPASEKYEFINNLIKKA